MTGGCLLEEADHSAAFGWGDVDTPDIVARERSTSNIGEQASAATSTDATHRHHVGASRREGVDDATATTSDHPSADTLVEGFAPDDNRLRTAETDVLFADQQNQHSRFYKRIPEALGVRLNLLKGLRINQHLRLNFDPQPVSFDTATPRLTIANGSEVPDSASGMPTSAQRQRRNYDHNIYRAVISMAYHVGVKKHHANPSQGSSPRASTQEIVHMLQKHAAAAQRRRRVLGRGYDVGDRHAAPAPMKDDRVPRIVAGLSRNEFATRTTRGGQSGNSLPGYSPSGSTPIGTDPALNP
eukprot:GSA25T00007873001.1